MLPNICQGEALFQTHENLEHLAMMDRVLGPLPEHMIQRVGCVVKPMAFFFFVNYVYNCRNLIVYCCHPSF